MQTDDKAGIICDNCGLIYKSEFKYYSFDFKKVEIYGNNRQSLQQILSLGTDSSLDICTSCFEDIKKKIISNYAGQMGSKWRPPQQHVVCELTGVKLSGTYTYYYCVVSLVSVNTLGQPSYCINCKTQTYDKNKPCSKCNNRKFITPAKVNSDQRFVEFNLSEDAYRAMNSQAANVKANQKKNWSTRSE